MAYFSYLLQRARLVSRKIVKTPPISGFFFRLMTRIGFVSVSTVSEQSSSSVIPTSLLTEELRSLRRLIKEVSSLDENEKNVILYEMYESFCINLAVNQQCADTQIAFSRLIRRLGQINVKVNKNL